VAALIAAYTVVEVLYVSADRLMSAHELIGKLSIQGY